MADMDQNGFNPDNVPRNTLACIEGDQNAAAGNQLKQFVEGTGWYSQAEKDNGGRSDECAGQLRDGDTYKVIFDYAGDKYDKSKVSFCTDDDGNLLNPDSHLDLITEFYLTKLGAETGRIDFPYDYSQDNRYADGLTRSDVQQCSVVLYRDGDSKFEANIQYGDGSAASAQFNLPEDGKSYTVEPPKDNDYESLKITRTEPIGTGDGSVIRFFYGLGTDRNFDWNSNFQGFDNTFNDRRPNQDAIPSVEGRYCVWTQVDDDKKQSITCYFPCNVPP